jgi:cell division protein FtsZ
MIFWNLAMRKLLVRASDQVDVTPTPERAAPRISTGGTLFERMSNLSRGLSRSDEEEDEAKDEGASAGLNIPRFLDRQSNN